MSTVIDELVTILGIELEPKTQAKINSFSSLLKRTTKFAVGLGAALTTAATGAALLAKQSAYSGHSMAKFSKLTGISTDTLQEWEFAMVKSGGDAKNLRSDMEGLLTSISSPIPGEFNHALFMMGVQAKDTSGNVRKIDDVLFDISEKMKGYSSQQQMVWGERLGISHDTIKLLKKGTSGIKEYLAAGRESGSIMSPERIKQGHKFVILLETTGRVLTFIRRELAASLLPILSKNIKAIAKWVKLNREWIKLKIADVTKGVAEGFKKFWKIVEKVMGVFAKFVPGVTQLADGLLRVEDISSAVQAALIAMGLAAASTALSFLPLIAGAAAFFLIIDDIIAYTEGRDSYTGDFVKGFRKVLNDFNKEFPELSGSFKEFFLLLKDVAVVLAQLAAGGLGRLLSDTTEFVNILSPLVKDLLKLMEASLPEDLKGFLKSVRSGIGGGEVGEPGSKRPSTTRYSLPIIGPARAALDAIKYFRTGPEGEAAGGAGPQQITNHNTITIPVNGAGSPQAVADRVLGGVGNTIASVSGG